MKTKSIIGLAALVFCSWVQAQPTPQTSVTITWKVSPSSNIVSQTVWWGAAGHGFDKTANIPPQATTFQLGGLLPATTYNIQISCTQSVGTSVTNNVDSPPSGVLVYTTAPTGKPNPPGQPQIAPGSMPSPNMIPIVWSLSSSTNILSQTVWWGLAAGSYTKSFGVPANATSYQITGLSPGTSYHIAITCTQGIGSGMTNYIPSNPSVELVHNTAPTERPTPPATPQVLSIP